MPVCVVLSESNEAPVLVRWALHFAHGERLPLVVLDATGANMDTGNASKDAERIFKVSAEELAEAPELSVLKSAYQAVEGLRGAGEGEMETWPEIELWRCKWHCSPNHILRFATEIDTTLLVSGTQRKQHPLAEPLFKSAPWRTILIRLGGADGVNCNEILVPCAGGAHSRAALQVAQGLCLANEGRKGSDCAVTVARLRRNLDIRFYRVGNEALVVGILVKF